MQQTLITSADKLRRQEERRRRLGVVQAPYILEPLHAEYRGGRRYELMKPFVVLSAIVGRITIPQGYITDFNSIPRLFWNILPPDDWAEGSVPHDKLCDAPHWSDDRLVTYQEAADVHREFSIYVGSPKQRADLMRWAIATFGPRW